MRRKMIAACLLMSIQFVSSASGQDYYRLIGETGPALPVGAALLSGQGEHEHQGSDGTDMYGDHMHGAGPAAAEGAGSHDHMGHSAEGAMVDHGRGGDHAAHGDHGAHRHINNVPIGVMGAHTHHAGEWMFSYRYMFMEMDDNRVNSHKVSDADVLLDFPITPTQMFMDMHMLGLMYAPTDDFTLMGMLPLLHIYMDHVNQAGRRFRTETDGVGDLRLTGLYVLCRGEQQQVHLNTGISFPTGSIDEVDETPAGPGQPLPYPMQLGSGTVDLFPGITYVGESEVCLWGGQALGTVHLGRNDRDYSLGERVDLTAWVGRKWTDRFSTSVRLDGKIWGNIDGADARLNPAMVPTADPHLRAGERLDLVFGANLYDVPDGNLATHKLGIEVGVPVHQRLDGPQLETDWYLIAGWQKYF